MKKKFIKIAVLLFFHNSFLFSQKISQLNTKIIVPMPAVKNLIENTVPKEFKGNGKLNLQEEISSKNNILALGISILKNKNSKQNYVVDWDYLVNREDIGIQIQKNSVSASTPFSGNVTADVQDIKKNFQSDFSGILNINTKFSIDPDWKIKTQTSPSLDLNKVYVPLDLSIAGIKINKSINISSELEKQLKSSTQKAGKALDEETAKIDLKGLVEKEWQKLKAPLLLDNNFQAYLTANVSKAFYSDIRNTDNSLEINLGSDAEIAVYIGNPKNANVSKVFPKIYPQNRGSQSTLYIPVIINYDIIKETLNQKLSGEEFYIGYASDVQVKNFNIREQNDNFQVKSDFILKPLKIFNLYGSLTAFGKPAVSQDKKDLSIKNFDFQLESDSTILKLVDKFFHNKIKNMIIENYLSFDFESEIPKIKEEINKNISDISLDNNITFKGNMENISISDISIKTKEIIIYTELTADTSIFIKTLN